MPVTSIDPKNRDDAIIGTGFAIQIGDEIKGWFTECSGLAAEREVKEHKEGGVNDLLDQKYQLGAWNRNGGHVRLLEGLKETSG